MDVEPLPRIILHLQPLLRTQLLEFLHILRTDELPKRL